MEIKPNPENLRIALLGFEIEEILKRHFAGWDSELKQSVEQLDQESFMFAVSCLMDDALPEIETLILEREHKRLSFATLTENSEPKPELRGLTLKFKWYMHLKNLLERTNLDYKVEYNKMSMQEKIEFARIEEEKVSELEQRARSLKLIK